MEETATTYSDNISMETVAIAILNFNGKDHLQQFLPSVSKYSASAKIYVIDNASADDSVSFIRSS